MDRSWTEALDLMRDALAILDQSAAPPEIGAHLDLAIARLEGRLNDGDFAPAGKGSLAGNIAAG